MSSRLANPSSTIRTAAIRYGTSSMLTMNPERSFVLIGCLPIDWAKLCAVCSACSDVSSATTTSTNFITGTGEKK